MMTDAEIEELEPCPWCGESKLNPTHFEGDGDWHPYMQMECEHCDKRVSFYADTFEEGIEVWNAQALLAKVNRLDELWSETTIELLAKSAEVKRLRAENKELKRTPYPIPRQLSEEELQMLLPEEEEEIERIGGKG